MTLLFTLPELRALANSTGTGDVLIGIKCLMLMNELLILILRIGTRRTYGTNTTLGTEEISAITEKFNRDASYSIEHIYTE